MLALSFSGTVREIALFGFSSLNKQGNVIFRVLESILLQSGKNGPILTTINHFDTPPQKPRLNAGWRWGSPLVFLWGGECARSASGCVCLFVESGVCGCMPQTAWKQSYKSTHTHTELTWGVCVRCDGGLTPKSPDQHGSYFPLTSHSEQVRELKTCFIFIFEHQMMPLILY